MKKYLIIIGLALAATVLGWAGTLWFSGNGELLNPLSGKISETPKKQSTVVVGFLPTWMVGKTGLYTTEVDELVFLGVDVGSSGNLIWDTQGKKINDQSYLDMKASIKNNGGKNILGIKIFNDPDIDEFLANDQAKLNLDQEIKSIVEVAGFDGVNIDFEYMGDAQRLAADDFLAWLQQLRGYGVGKISVDVMANSIIKGDPDKWKQLADESDEMIIMAYDFHRPTSDNAGSVAPIAANTGERNIGEISQKILDNNFPKEKVVMAYPLYGYMWQTKDLTLDSPTIGTGWMVSWNETKTKTAADGKYGDTNGTVNWDGLSMTPWVSYSEVVPKTKTVWQKIKGKWRKVTQNYSVTEYFQAFFENERSLSAKIDLVRQDQLGGVGFWALGYEGNDTNVWKIVKEKINR